MPENKHMTTRLKELFERPEVFVLPGGMLLPTTSTDAFSPVVVQAIAPNPAPLTYPILNAGPSPICPAFHPMYVHVTQTFSD